MFGNLFTGTLTTLRRKSPVLKVAWFLYIWPYTTRVLIDLGCPGRPRDEKRRRVREIFTASL